MAKTKTKADSEQQNATTEVETEANTLTGKKSFVSDKDTIPPSKGTETFQNETTPSTEPNKDEDSGGRGATFWIILPVAGSIGLCLLLFIVATIVGITSGRWENVASMIAIIRDLLIILLIMEGILVGIALIAMIVQLSLLLNVLQNEIRPILENAQQTAATVKGTARFVSKHVTSPIIRVKSTVTGTRAFFRGVGDLRAMTANPGKANQADEDEGVDLEDNQSDDDSII